MSSSSENSSKKNEDAPAAAATGGDDNTTTDPTTTTAPIFSTNRQIIRASILVAILAVSVHLTKDMPNNNSTTTTWSSSYKHELTLLHLLAFASWFGCSVWVSFVAGLIMFRNLPRHTFGRLQSKLFPAYFWFSAITITIAIATAMVLPGGNNYRKDCQVPLGTILSTILVNLVYLEPTTTAVMFERHVVERKLGTGHEIGQLKPKDPKIAENPELKALSKKFGMLHGLSSLMNLVALGVGCYWINYLTKQIVVGGERANWTTM